jgi:hypothetical protein
MTNKKFDNKSLGIEPMSLKFFSSHFLIKKKYLEYGIVVKINRVTAEIDETPAILIKDSRLFINIWDDCWKVLRAIATTINSFLASFCKTKQIIFSATVNTKPDSIKMK